METNEFVRAKTDKKEYKLYVLPNGLEVLLVSDQTRAGEEEDEEEEESISSGSISSEEGEEEEDEDEEEENTPQRGGCAVAMAVNCGQFHERATDPHGLAHLLEHMLFMGSEKYPNENAYDDFLSKHGGYSNAYTEAEHTMYYFELGSAQALPQAMDIFAQFFISPLMKADSLAREIHAVDSEFDLTLSDDEVRARALWHLPTTPAKHHPFHRFGWGNEQSLRADGDTAKLQTQLRDFYAQYYSTGSMKLVVWSTDSLAVMEEQVTAIFSHLPPARELAPTPFDFPGPFEESAGHVFKIVPVNDLHNLRLTWQHTALTNYKSKPWSYLAHMLGHESEGGILAHLKRKHWANDVWAGTSPDDGEENNSMFSLFAMDIKLTQSGVEHVDEVILAVYAYLGMLKRAGLVVDWIFHELDYIAQIAFDFKDDGEPSEQACELAYKLLPTSHLTDKRDLFTCDTLMFDCNAEDVHALARSLGVRGAQAPRIDLVSSTFGREADLADQAAWQGLVEPHWKTKYTKERMDDQLILRCEAALQGETPLSREFALPPRNHYIPFDGLQVAPIPNKRREMTEEDALCHGLLRASVEIQTKVGKQQLWLPATILRARRGAQNGAVECFFQFETDARVWFPLESTPHEFEDRCTYLFASQRVRLLSAPHLYAQPIPVLLPISSSGLRFWHLQDSIFNVPRSALFVFLGVPRKLTLRERVLADLLCNVCVNHVLCHNIYLAKMAELDLRIRYQEQESGFTIRVLGFSPKVTLFVKEAVQALLALLLGNGSSGKKNPAPQVLVTPEIFAFERESLLREYANAESELDVQANAHRYRALLKSYSKQDLHAALLDMVDSSIATGGNALIPISSAECLYHGNVSQTEAARAMKELASLLSQAPPARLICRPERAAVFSIPRSAGKQAYLLFPSKEASEKTAALQMYFQLEVRETPHTLAVCEVLESLLEEPFFNELRTQQQVGYVVYASLRRTLGTLGFSFEISSSKFPVYQLIAKVEAFLLGFRNRVLQFEVDEEELRHRARAVRKRTLQKDNNIFEETKRHWSHVLDQTYAFNEHLCVAHELTHVPKPGNKFGVTLREVTRMFDEAFSARNRKLLVVAVVGGANEVTSLARERENVPPALTLFKTMQEFWDYQPPAAATAAASSKKSSGHKRKQ